MITSAKKYTKKNNNKKRKRTDRTLGQMVKAKLYRQNHTKAHTHAHPQKIKRKKIFVSIYQKKRKRATKSINKCTCDNKV